MPEVAQTQAALLKGLVSSSQFYHTLALYIFLSDDFYLFEYPVEAGHIIRETKKSTKAKTEWMGKLKVSRARHVVSNTGFLNL